ncbi:MAG: hypothetical protein PHH21_01760 [Candidatus Pacebacteria bacterium]|nr:hypothetical protein [Candidatus Paceibacterota bacterium]
MKKMIGIVAVISVVVIVVGIVALNWAQATPAPTNSAQSSTYGGLQKSMDNVGKDLRSDSRFQKEPMMPDIDPATISIAAIVGGLAGIAWCGYEIRRKPIPG